MEVFEEMTNKTALTCTPRLLITSAPGAPESLIETCSTYVRQLESLKSFIKEKRQSQCGEAGDIATFCTEDAHLRLKDQGD